MSMASLEKKLRADGYALVRLDAPPEYGRLDDLKRCFGIKRSAACDAPYLIRQKASFF
jgi:hypothetical protein